MFWGVMLFSFVGSAFTGLVSYTRADDRVAKLRALERLVEIAIEARTAETMQALDELYRDMNAIHANMVHEVEDNTLDETAMMAYQVSLEQARLALSDRQAVLQGLPPKQPLAAVESL